MKEVLKGILYLHNCKKILFPNSNNIFSHNVRFSLSLVPYEVKLKNEYKSCY